MRYVGIWASPWISLHPVINFICWNHALGTIWIVDFGQSGPNSHDNDGAIRRDAPVSIFLILCCGQKSCLLSFWWQLPLSQMCQVSKYCEICTLEAVKAPSCCPPWIFCTIYLLRHLYRRCFYNWILVREEQNKPHVYMLKLSRFEYFLPTTTLWLNWLRFSTIPSR